MASSKSSKHAAQQTASQLKDYFADLPPDARRRLKQIRAAIRAAAPGSIDAYSYGIPAARLEGRILVWYAAWKEHCSLYPMTAATRRGNAVAMRAYKVSKGTIQFPHAKPLPVALVRRLVRARRDELLLAAKQ